MKYYFMSWQSQLKEGDAIWEFKDDVTPREALKAMRESVAEQFKLDSVLVVLQFNNVV